MDESRSHQEDNSPIRDGNSCIGENAFTTESGDALLLTPDQVNRELSAMVRRAALPIIQNDRVVRQIERAADRLKFPLRLVKRLWYQELRLVPAHVALMVIRFDRRAARLDPELAELRRRLDALEHGSGLRDG